MQPLPVYLALGIRQGKVGCYGICKGAVEIALQAVTVRRLNEHDSTARGVASYVVTKQTRCLFPRKCFIQASFICNIGV